MTVKIASLQKIVPISIVSGNLLEKSTEADKLRIWNYVKNLYIRKVVDSLKISKLIIVSENLKTITDGGLLITAIYGNRGIIYKVIRKTLLTERKINIPILVESNLKIPVKEQFPKIKVDCFPKTAGDLFPYITTISNSYHGEDEFPLTDGNRYLYLEGFNVITSSDNAKFISSRYEEYSFLALIETIKGVENV